MKIKEITENRKQFLTLHLLADEQKTMIDTYLERETMYVLEDNGVVKSECVATDEGNGILEIKNLAAEKAYQHRGYARTLLDFIAAKYRKTHCILQAGTDESPLTLPFYEKYGFVQTHRIKNFFLENYDHPVFEAGIQLVDMIYLQKKL